MPVGHVPAGPPETWGTTIVKRHAAAGPTHLEAVELYTRRCTCGWESDPTTKAKTDERLIAHLVSIPRTPEPDRAQQEADARQALEARRRAKAQQPGQ